MNIYEDAVLKIVAREGGNLCESGSVLLSFTGVGHAMGGIDVQKPEFFGAGKTFDNIIFITDTTRSWSNALDYRTIKECIAPYIDGKEVHSIGNSMGGFNAIISTHHIPTKTCIAFSPQFSIDPEQVPWERRWRNYSSQIEHYSVENAGIFMNATTCYYIFSGGDGLDYKHAKLFPVAKNIFHRAVKNVEHNVAQTLKEDGILGDVIRSCFEHRPETLGLECEQLSP
ncbi:hypothetical protein [Paracoccus sp. SM22M-07]|uniref:hypothetical protein n=1 Tax=Paracoccus sp. SM22M-07 TaxID=1520813 RepID=UPI000916B4CA|nr:hypothetical protein [Paracoccus sp. SM22M-07]OJH43032.1 hypothetical protein IE00_19105 [Paracoccus sp. SM22M-07]